MVVDRWDMVVSNKDMVEWVAWEVGKDKEVWEEWEAWEDLIDPIHQAQNKCKTE